VLLRRRLLAALLTLLAVAAGLHALAPPAPATVALTVAARDLPAGSVLRERDLAQVAVDPGSRPDGVVEAAAGRTLAAPVRRGEPITDLRLVGASYTAGRPDLVAVPVRLPDPGVAALLRPGEEVTLLATDPAAGSTERLGEVLVLAVPPEEASTTAVMDPGSGRLVVVGVHDDEVEPVTGAAARLFLTVAFRH